MPDSQQPREALARVIRRVFLDPGAVNDMVTADKDERIYTHGQVDSAVYYIQRGQIKLLVVSPDGKECITNIHGEEALFGELCLCGDALRSETAVAMRPTILRRASAKAFMGAVAQEGAVQDLVKYLAFRLAEQQEVIATLLTAGSEQRLARALLALSMKIGRENTPGQRLAPYLLQEELAEMVGTTRSYVGVFLRRFKERGLISEADNHSLMVHEHRMKAFLAGLPSAGDDPSGPCGGRNSRGNGKG